MKASDVSGFLSEHLLVWSFVKPRLGGLVSQPQELLTTSKNLLIISMVLCTRDGRKQPVWGMEPVLLMFLFNTNFCNFS